MLIKLGSKEVNYHSQNNILGGKYIYFLNQLLKEIIPNPQSPSPKFPHPQTYIKINLFKIIKN